jgi:hypothetical protein
VIDLLDLLKNVDHKTGFTTEFSSVASRTVTDADVLRRRLLLCVYGLGTKVGIKRVADGVATAIVRVLPARVCPSQCSRRHLSRGFGAAPPPRWAEGP